MTASGPPPNQLLQILDAANFALLRSHLVRIEMVRETVSGKAGAVAMLGRDSVVGGGAALANGIASADAVVPFRQFARAGNDVLRLLFHREGPSPATVRGPR